MNGEASGSHSTPRFEGHTVVERLAPNVEQDRILREVFAGKVRTGERRERLLASGIDRVACAIARSVVGTPEATVALTAPRGAGQLPVLVGLYLGLWRRVPNQAQGRMVGSLSIATRNAQLRNLARSLQFDGSDMQELVPVGRLAAVPTADHRHIRPVALDLRTRMPDGLDQQDAWLLFQRPNINPPLAYNVVCAMVVDAAGSSALSWELTYERNRAARRRQVWVGELGDTRFERFCDDRAIPLVRLDWELAAAAVQRWGVGTSPLSSARLAERAVNRLPIGARVVQNDEVMYWLAQLHTLLSEMEAKARATDTPDVFITARHAASLLTRMACPLEFYESAASGLAFAETLETLVERVEHVTATPFRGRWKPAYATYWPPIKGCLRQLCRLLGEADTSPKWWAVQQRIDQAAGANERLRILCQTRAERLALREALLSDDCCLDENMLEAHVDVASFSDRRPSDANSETVTLLLSPPPERFANVYLSGDSGRVEVLIYPFERRRLRSRTVSSYRSYTDPEPNHVALDTLGIGRRPVHITEPRIDADDLVVDLEGFAEHVDFELPDVEDGYVATPDPESDFWERALELRGEELRGELDDSEDDEEAPGGGDRASAVLVTFDQAPQMYLREDAAMTVVTLADDGEPDVQEVPASLLEPGMRLAVLPGAHRGSLLNELMATWDEQLATFRSRYEPMYRRALEAAVERHGVEGVAQAVGLSEAAVRTWVAGSAKPGTDVHLRLLLDASGDDVAIANQAVIHDLFSRTRGAHRLIGRVLNEAVGETVLHGAVGGENLARLKEIVGTDLTDVLDDVIVLRVTDVSEPRNDVPAALCGSFLDRDDPFIARHEGELR